MADNDSPIEDILAAARGADGTGQSSASEESDAESIPASEESVTEAAEAVSNPDPSKMSVADMLAAARGESSGESEAAESKPVKEKAAPSKPAAKPAAAKPEPAAPADSPDTASILASARKETKRGPRSFEEAAQAGEVPKPAKPKVVVPPAPVKSDFLPSKAAAVAKPDADRRGFLANSFRLLLGTPLAVGFTGMAVTTLIWTLGFARFMFPNVLTEPPTKFKVGFPDRYSPGQVEAKFKAQFGVWVVRYEYEGESQIYALKTVCTHLGCTPNWLEGEQKFKCPCHGSGFYKDGVNFEGPAPRPLERYAIRLADDGQLEIDKSRKFNEELGQWSDTSSFVSV